MNIREATVSDSAAIASIHVDSWRSTYRGILADDHLASLSKASLQQFWIKSLQESEYGSTRFMLVAEDNSIVGFVDGGPERSGDSQFTAEIYALYLLEDHQRRGTGTKLLRLLAENLSSAGFESVLIWVLSENSSRKFYEALGGEEIRRQMITIGGNNYEETAYGWSDIGTLTGKMG